MSNVLLRNDVRFLSYYSVYLKGVYFFFLTERYSQPLQTNKIKVLTRDEMMRDERK